MSANYTTGQYEVLSPWAEADPIPPRGLTAPRLSALEGKKIGLLCNTKRAARPILAAVEGILAERYPTAQISWYFALNAIGPEEVQTQNKEKFEKWLQEVDAVIEAVGD